MPKELLELLAPVVEAGRSVLADMEPSDVPAKLRRVAQSSARTLPPPLARSLLTAVDDDEAFRRRVVEEMDARGNEDPVAVAFAGRAPGWWADVARALVESAGAEAARREHDREAEIARLARFASEAEARVREARADAADARAESARRVEQARAQERALVRSEQGSVERAAQEAAALKAEVADAQTALAEANATAAVFRERLRRMRRSRPIEEGGSRESPPQDPAELARALDIQFEQAASSPPLVASPPQPRDGDGISLPVGVAPDSPDALRWLRTAPAATVIVDGYNVLFRAEPAGSLTGAARRRLDQALRRLHRQSGHSIIVVYDSTVTGERSPGAAVGGVRTRFAEADRLADEEIIELAASSTGPTVVISSDREVQEAVRQAGAVVLWSEALVPLLLG